MNSFQPRICQLIVSFIIFPFSTKKNFDYFLFVWHFQFISGDHFEEPPEGLDPTTHYPLPIFLWRLMASTCRVLCRFHFHFEPPRATFQGQVHRLCVGHICELFTLGTANWASTSDLSPAYPPSYWYPYPYPYPCPLSNNHKRTMLENLLRNLGTKNSFQLATGLQRTTGQQEYRMDKGGLWGELKN